MIATFMKTGGQEDGPTRNVNPNTGISPPEFKHKYTPIVQTNLKFSAISAMMVRRPHLYCHVEMGLGLNLI